MTFRETKCSKAADVTISRLRPRPSLKWLVQICLVWIDHLDVVSKDKNTIDGIDSKRETDYYHEPKDNPACLVRKFAPNYKIQYEERSRDFQNNHS